MKDLLLEINNLKTKVDDKEILNYIDTHFYSLHKNLIKSYILDWSHFKISLIFQNGFAHGTKLNAQKQVRKIFFIILIILSL